MHRANDIAAMKKVGKITRDWLQAQGVGEVQKRRVEEDKQLTQLHKLTANVVLSDSKVRVLVTLMRKTWKYCEDAMASEVAFATMNRVDAKAQCLQIMQDHKSQGAIDHENRAYFEVK